VDGWASEWRARATDLLGRIASFVFGKPAVCALCGALLRKKASAEPADASHGSGARVWNTYFDLDFTESGICGSCLDKLASEMSWVCHICGAPIPPPLRTCQDCLKNMYQFDAQRSAGIYQGELRDAITRMKFQRERWLSRPLSYLMARAAQEFLPVDLLVPVPIDPSSARQRGYNQALDLAKELSSLLRVPVLDILEREKRYAHQAELARNMRWKNLQESMGPKRDVNLTGARVLLVDDVTTTGATLDEAARVLKRLGAARVYCVTVARTTRR